jgi:hypothetical protein
VPPPQYDADAATKAALADYDKNNNGSIEATEADACPALKTAFKAFDTNGDRVISADELKARFARYASAAGGAGAVSTQCRVTFDGAPLAGATVRLVPERCMGESFRPAAGTTDDTGAATIRPEVEGWAGVYPGLYKITVSKPDGAGKETLPARYNAQTTLGREVFEDRGSTVTIELKLTR